MVQELLAIAPQMVLISDSKGDYPLHIAIHNQQSYETIRHLFEAFPCARKIGDANTNLLPFMLAAVGNWKNKKDQISVTYRLLREDPYSMFYV